MKVLPAPNGKFNISFNFHPIFKDHEHPGVPHVPYSPVVKFSELKNEEILGYKHNYKTDGDSSFCRKKTFQLYFGCEVVFHTSSKSGDCLTVYNAADIVKFYSDISNGSDFVDLSELFHPNYSAVKITGVTEGFFVCVNFINLTDTRRHNVKTVKLLTSSQEEYRLAKPNDKEFWIVIGDAIIDGKQNGAKNIVLIENDCVVTNFLSPTSGVIKIEY